MNPFLKYPELRRALLTWFGCGLVPKAPGTAGSLGTMPLAWVMCFYAPLSVRLFVAVFLTAFACWLSGLEQLSTDAKDPQYIVIDESAGILWATAWCDTPTWPWLVAAFVLFRIFDVVKPFPANLFDRASKTAASPYARGAHIVLDDVVAGLYAAGLLWVGGMVWAGYFQSTL